MISIIYFSNIWKIFYIEVQTFVNKKIDRIISLDF